MYVIAFQILQAMDESNGVRLKKMQREPQKKWRKIPVFSLTNYNHQKKSFWRRGSNLKQYPREFEKTLKVCFSETNTQSITTS